MLPGTGTTDNPYDAVPTALAANFNTIAVRKIGGQVVSAESHTPLTAYSESFGKSLRRGELRVNTGPNPHNAEQYFGELLAAFLQKHGVAADSQIVFGYIPKLAVFYTHENSKTLGEIVRSMLKYSTNFVANQLILTLSAEDRLTPPMCNATWKKHFPDALVGVAFHWRMVRAYPALTGFRHNSQRNCCWLFVSGSICCRKSNRAYTQNLGR